MTLIIILIIGMALSEMIIEITTKNLMKTFGLKTMMQFNDLIIKNKEWKHYEKFMTKINSNKKNIINYMFLTGANTFYLLLIFIGMFTQIWYVSLLLIILMCIKNLSNFLIKYEGIISVLILASGLLVFIK